MAPTAFSATASTPFSESHFVISSIAAARACWLCRSNVRASAVATLESELFGMSSSLSGCSGEGSQGQSNHHERCIRCTPFLAPEQCASPISVPCGLFSDAKNHKPPIFSKKISDLRLLNVAVKERFELHQTFAVINALRDSSLASASGR